MRPWGIVFAVALVAACSDEQRAREDTGPPDLGPDAALVDAGDAGADAADGAVAPDQAPDGPDCSPSPPVANRHLLTKLQADLAALTDPAQRQAAVDAFMASVEASRVWPVRDHDVVVFLYRGDAAVGISVAGTFNGWQPGADVMSGVPGTDLRYLELSVGAARHEYKLVIAAGAWLRDALNPHVAWDGIPSTGLGAFNSVIPPWGTSDPQGRLEAHRVASPELGNTREVFVYLPAGYDDDTCRRYPVLLVNDGNESITRGHFDEVAGDTFAAGGAAPAILVFVALANQAERMSEYSCDPADQGDEYADFLCDTLLPLVDQRYRSAGTPESRGIAGASLGGLISYAAVRWRSDCLRRAGAQSGSFWYKEDMLIERVKSSSGGVQLAGAYLDNGSDNRDATIAMWDALQAAGFTPQHREELLHGHTWDAWEERFDELLIHLYPPGP